MSESVAQDKPLIHVDNLAVQFPVSKGIVHAVKGISFDLMRGQTLGLVGESGCGKSTTARALIGLQKAHSGHIYYHETDYTQANKRRWRDLRRLVQLVFQDPYASLNPRMCVGDIIAEPLRNYGIGSPATRQARIKELLTLVGLDPHVARRFPHEFSGGQRQRIGIARALALEPEVLICDEPVSALDVSVQAQIINLLMSLRQQLNLTLVIIAHDLAVVRHLADKLAVMYLGTIVEYGSSQDIFSNPQHPYTQSLLNTIPSGDPKSKERLLTRDLIQGEASSHEEHQAGCPFAPRCPVASESCTQRPVLATTQDGGHEIACWHPQRQHG